MAERGHLEETERHTIAESAMKWIFDNHNMLDLLLLRESCASCAIEGNGVCEICGETLSRLINGEHVSDRYLLGLAWFMRDSKERDDQ